MEKLIAGDNDPYLFPIAAFAQAKRNLASVGQYESPSLQFCCSSSCVCWCSILYPTHPVGVGALSFHRKRNLKTKNPDKARFALHSLTWTANLNRKWTSAYFPFNDEQHAKSDHLIT